MGPHAPREFLLQRGVWEALAPDGNPATRESAGGTFASLAHGWASGRLRHFQSMCSGCVRSNLVTKTWLIEPQPGDLSWAEGRVPTPETWVSVQEGRLLDALGWSRGNTDSGFAGWGFLLIA
jgi:hypothetical protein